MVSNKQQSGSSTPRFKVWVSLVTTTLGIVGILISTIVATSKVSNVAERWIPSAAAAFIAVVIAAAFTSMLALRERGPSRISKLKDDLSNAYLSALDTSSLNPRLGGSK